MPKRPVGKLGPNQNYDLRKTRRAFEPDDGRNQSAMSGNHSILNLDLARSRQDELIESIERRQIISELSGGRSMASSIRAHISSSLITAGKRIQPNDPPAKSEPVFDSNILNLGR